MQKSVPKLSVPPEINSARSSSPSGRANFAVPRRDGPASAMLGLATNNISNGSGLLMQYLSVGIAFKFCLILNYAESRGIRLLDQLISFTSSHATMFSAAGTSVLVQTLNKIEPTAPCCKGYWKS